jgi:hypothetical protein
MKRFTLSLLVLAALALYANTPPFPEGGAVGRYQCTAGTLHGMTEPEDREATFRIDTATGKTWLLQAVPLQTATGSLWPLPTWIEVNETNGELYKAAMASLNK